MRRIVPTALSLLAIATALGCAQSNPAAKLATAPAARTFAAEAASAPAVATAPAATVRVVTGPEADAQEAAEAAADTAPVVAIEGAPTPPADEAVAEAPMVDFAALSAAPARRSVATGEAGAANILDPWRPYGVGIVSKTATTVTLAWRTDLDSKAIVYFGKSFGLSRRGYDGVAHDTNSSKFHQITITGLSRFRSYTFGVVGLGALGMQFPTYPFKTRTNLF